MKPIAFAFFFCFVTKPEGIKFCFGERLTSVAENQCMTVKFKGSLICLQLCSNGDSGGEILIITFLNDKKWPFR